MKLVGKGYALRTFVLKRVGLGRNRAFLGNRGKDTTRGYYTVFVPHRYFYSALEMDIIHQKKDRKSVV